MTATIAAPQPAPPGLATTGARVDAAVARRTFRQLWLGATGCGLAFGATAASSALSYVSSFPTEAARHQLAVTTGSDRGLSVLLGPVASIGTVGGYTVYKGFVFLTTIGAVWAVLAATRVLRGEEDTGRWQVVLAGATRPARATAACLLALGGAVGVIFAGTTVFTLLAGRSHDVGFGAGPTLLYGLSVAIPPAVFAGVGAVTSQLSRTRRAASGLGMGVFGVAFLVRMVADSGAATRWLLWATPFGWTELMRPFTRNDPWPVVPAAVATIALGAAAVVLASRRDAGDGLLASRDVARLRPFGLGSAFGIAVRLERGVLAAWCAGALAAGLMLGIITKITTAKVPDSFRSTLDKFGVKGSFANQYLGVAFLLVATLVALVSASQIGAASSEETSGRLAHVLAATTRRATWLAGRLALSAAAILVAALLAAFGAWLAATSQGVDLGLGSLVGAGLNVVPTALLVLGAGALVLSVAPRRAAASVYVVVIWSVLVDILALVASGTKWLDRVSLFHYMALAPAQGPDPATLAITTVAAALCCVAAVVVFDRRDLRTE